MINQTDIDYIVGLLNKAVKTRDWDTISEAQEYLTEFQDDPQYEEE
jgi:hypothetical protein